MRGQTVASFYVIKPRSRDATCVKHREHGAIVLKALSSGHLPYRNEILQGAQVRVPWNRQTQEYHVAIDTGIAEYQNWWNLGPVGRAGVYGIEHVSQEDVSVPWG